MKRKQGISLIVLVITIIVMIILAASVVITLSNAGIIGKASDAITTTDLKNIQQEAETVKLLEFGNNITMNGHQARMNKNILIQKLLEHFKGSTQEGDKIITADGKYVIIVTDDLTIIVMPNEKAKRGDLLVNISYDNSSKQVPVTVYVTPTIYGWEGETNEGQKYSTYQEYAEAVLANVKTDEELEQIFVDGQNYWNEVDNLGEPHYKDINELIEYWNAEYREINPLTVEGLCDAYGYSDLREMSIAWEYVKPEAYGMAEGEVLIKCSNGEILKVITGETAEFTINYPGEITFAAISFSGKRVNKKIQIEAPISTFTLLGRWYGDNVIGTFEFVPGMTWEEWVETPLTKGVLSYSIDYEYNYLYLNFLEVDGTIVDEDGYVKYSDLIESKEYYLEQEE